MWILGYWTVKIQTPEFEDECLSVYVGNRISSRLHVEWAPCRFKRVAMTAVMMTLASAQSPWTVFIYIYLFFIK